MNTELRDIPGFEGRYAATKDGRIWSYGTKSSNRNINGMFLKGYRIRGYENVKLYVNGIRMSRLVHRLVAQAWIENPLCLPQINHKNGVKHDNRIDNLEWCTGQENVDHAISTGLITPGLKTRGENGPLAKLTWNQVRSIRKLYSENEKTAIELKNIYKVCISTIYDILYRKTWVEND